MGHWSAWIKTTKGREELNRGAENEKQAKEMEVDEATLQVVNVQVQSPKSKMIRVE